MLARMVWGNCNHQHGNLTKLLTGLEILYILGARLRAKKKVQEPKKKGREKGRKGHKRKERRRKQIWDEKRKERSRKEKKGGSYTKPNQTVVGAKKIQEDKGKRGRQGKYWSKKREDKRGMRGDETKICWSQKIRQCA